MPIPLLKNRLSRNKTRQNLRNLPQPVGIVSDRGADTVVIARPSGGVKTLARSSALEHLRFEEPLATCARGSWSLRTYLLSDVNLEPEISELDADARVLATLDDELNWEELQANYFRSSLGTVAVTHLRARDAEGAQLSVAGFQAAGARGGRDGETIVESISRSVTRAWLEALLPSEFEELKENGETRAFLVILNDGFAFGLWEAARGVLYEIEGPLTAGGTERGEDLFGVLEELAEILNAESYASLKLNIPARLIVVGAPEDCSFISQEPHEFVLQNTEFEFFSTLATEAGEAQMPVAPEVVIAYGLSLSAERLPRLNLARNLRAEVIRTRELETVAAARAVAVEGRNNLLILMLPIACAVLCLMLFAAGLLIERTFYARRMEAAASEERRLVPVSKEIDEINRTSEQVATLERQIARLRSRQPTSFNLLLALNNAWPRNASGVWRIDEVSTKTGGGVTIKGRTTSPDALNQFVRALEFGGSFRDLKVASSDGARPTPATGGENSGAQSIGNSGGAEGGGPIGFVVEARFIPLADLTQPPPAQTQPPPAQTTATAPAANAKPEGK